MSNEIKKLLPTASIIGNPNPPRTGSFEVIINGKLIYSKFSTNIFPTKIEIKSWF